MIMVSLGFFCGQLIAEEVVGYSIYPNIETPHPYPKATEKNTLVWSTTVQEPGTAWVKIHFSDFRLNPNDFVDLIDMNGNLIERIKGSDVARKRQSKFNVKKNENNPNTVSFWGSAVEGKEVKVELHRTTNKENDWGFAIDELGVGFSPIFGNANSNVNISRIGRNWGTDREDNVEKIVGIMLYRKNSTWYKCEGVLDNNNINRLLPDEPCIDSQAIVDTLEVRFYCKSVTNKGKSFSVYFTFFGDNFINHDFGYDRCQLTLKNDLNFDGLPYYIRIPNNKLKRNSLQMKGISFTAFCYPGTCNDPNCICCNY